MPLTDVTNVHPAKWLWQVIHLAHCVWQDCIKTMKALVCASHAPTESGATTVEQLATLLVSAACLDFTQVWKELLALAVAMRALLAKPARQMVRAADHFAWRVIKASLLLQAP
jgi:hypothetical protein